MPKHVQRLLGLAVGLWGIYAVSVHAQTVDPPVSELYNRVLQSGAALGAGIRSMSNDVAALVNGMQKDSIAHTEQLTWWSACAKHAECLDWLKSGIGHE